MRPVEQLFDLSGKVAIVTGGSRGIGKEIAEGLAEAGASLMIAARRPQWLEPAVAEFQSRGFLCEGRTCDVSKPDDVKAVTQATLSQFGQIDILINNAGIAWAAPAEEVTLEKWQAVIDTNLTGAFLFSREVGREMLRRKFGRIVNIASINAVQGGLPMGTIHTASYVASKGGLIALTRELAAKWGPSGIRVNAIAPGYFSTRMTENIPAHAKRRLEDIPLQRGGREDELKGVALFLVADASNYITGQTLIVDGGTVLV